MLAGRKNSHPINLIFVWGDASPHLPWWMHLSHGRRSHGDRGDNAPLNLFRDGATPIDLRAPPTPQKDRMRASEKCVC